MNDFQIYIKEKNLDWLLKDCKEILKEVNIVNGEIKFIIEEVDFGTKQGRLLIKENDRITVTKTYSFVTSDMHSAEFIIKENKFMLK